jgi:type IV secretory pathway VirB2 component (pilin)
MHNKFETLARGGYFARGVVYILLGGLALTSAFYGGSNPQGSSDALSTILGWPFGRILMGLVAIGLFGYVLWRLAQGLLNADGVEDNWKGFAGRVGSLISAGANVFLALTAARMALGSGGGGGGGNGEEQASAWLLQQPFGPFLLGIAALGIIVAGLIQIWKGASKEYQKRIHIPADREKGLNLVCQFGLIARGALLAIVGGFVLYAAFTVSPGNAGGISQALDYVHGLPFGRWLYGLAALGLVAFGGYSIVQALYRQVNAPDMGDVKRAVPGMG